MCFLLLSGSVAVITVDQNPDQSESTPAMKSKWHYVRRFLEWFCGLNSSATTTPKQVKTRLRDMTSLHQTHRARAALCTALTVLFTLDIFLYAFFSTGSDFGLLRNRLPPTFGNLSAYTTTVSMPVDHHWHNNTIHIS